MKALVAYSSSSDDEAVQKLESKENKTNQSETTKKRYKFTYLILILSKINLFKSLSENFQFHHG